MAQTFKILGLLSAFGAAVQAAPVEHHLFERDFLGSNFGVAGTNATFDYIVIGGGNAGLVLATRLAEQQQGSVAVVEAGGFYEVNNGNISQIPADDGIFAGKGLTDWQPLIDWGYITTPQAGAFNEEIHYPRGKSLGGCTARNYMAYQRATKEGYQRWADAVDDQSFAFDNLLPFFEKSVHFTPPDNALRGANATPQYDPTVLGNGSGPLSLTFSHYAQSWATWAVKGLEAIGIPVINGFESGALLGQSYTMFTINATTMHRDSSETSFLRRAIGLPNYMVYQSTLAKKILFDSNKKATGVLLDTEGLEYTLTATKEVILSGGVFGSPQLLMASGIGPAATLEGLGIPVIANRPGVGQNMQDHIYAGPSYRVNGITISSLQDPAFAAQAAKEYDQNAAGIYTNPVVDLFGWEKIPQPLRSTLSNSTLEILDSFPADWPEVEYLALGVFLGDQFVPDDPNDGFNYASMAFALTQPQSRGNLTITSPDTAVHPAINPNWLTAQADIEVAVVAYKRIREFWQTAPMKSFTIGEEAFPGLQVQTDEEIINVIRQSFNTVYHAACTCAMGLANDTQAVVDSHSRVIGVTGLRVVDASVFPFLPPGHPQATVYMLAEKMACDISGAC